MAARVIAVVGLAAMLCGGVGDGCGSAVGQTLPITPGPQQMTPSGVPAAYPSTAAVDPRMPVPPTQAIGPGFPTMNPNLPGGLALPGGGLPGELGGPDPAAGEHPLDPGIYMERSLTHDDLLSWQLLPSGLMYRSYLAGGREPRIGSQWVHLRDRGWRWDATIGGRVGILRYGTDNELWPQGFQMDVEAAAFPRLDLEHLRDLDDVDFRAGVPFTTRLGPMETKFGYYHVSSHAGDEFMQRFPEFQRINYVRESLIFGAAVYLNPALRLYSEVGYAFYVDGGALPWEFQFGADFSSIEPTGPGGAPFFAINGHLRQENDFGGNLAVETGWQWRGQSGHLVRIGLHYFNGMSDQYQFFNTFEEQLGAGVWYDY